MKRSEKREFVFKLLYQFHFSMKEEMEDQISYFFEENEMEEENQLYIKNEVENISANLSYIDGLIEKFSKGWKSTRINKVDLAILRLAIYEMIYKEESEVPVKVAINEAIELAKKYSDDKAYAFINGILGSIEKDVKQHEGKNE